MEKGVIYKLENYSDDYLYDKILLSELNKEQLIYVTELYRRYKDLQLDYKILEEEWK